MPEIVTLAQIALYTGVQRSSVSNWRRRHADFPDPTGGTSAQPLFGADAISRWLDQRPAPPGGRRTDEPTYGELFRTRLRESGPSGGAGLDGDSLAHIGLELVALRTAHRQPLPADSAALTDLCAAVESAYPDLIGLFDRWPMHEAAATTMLSDVERLVSELGTGGAAERILSTARRRGWSGNSVETPNEICALTAHLAGQLLGDLAEVTVADLAAGPGRLLTAVCDAGHPREIRYAETDPARNKWLRLRLFCHGHQRLTRHRDGQITDDIRRLNAPSAMPVASRSLSKELGLGLKGNRSFLAALRACAQRPPPLDIHGFDASHRCNKLVDLTGRAALPAPLANVVLGRSLTTVLDF